MRSFGRFCYLAFCVMFLALPALALCGSLYQLLSMGAFVWGALGAAAVLAVGILFFRRQGEAEKPRLRWAILPVLLSVLFRLVCFWQIGDHMQMLYDYQTALESARGVYAAKEAIFTHWAFYPRILSLWFSVFSDSYASAVLFHIVVGAGSVFLTYLIGAMLFKQLRPALAASLLLALWPSYGYYHSVTSNEHLAIFSMLLTVFLFLTALRSQGKKRWFFVVLTGFAAGSADLFKQFSPVFLIAVFLCLFVFLCLREKGKSAFLQAGAALVLLFFASSLVTGAAHKALERYLGEPVCRNTMAHFFYVGLNAEAQGVWSEETGMKIYELTEEYDGDYDKVQEELWTLVIQDLKENPEALPNTILHKMKIDWAADSGVVDWISWLYEGGTAPMPYISLLYVGSAAYYIAIMLLLFCGSLFAFTKQNIGMMLLRLIPFGYALLLVFSEAQGRYQMVLFPFFALLAANGAQQLMILLRKKREEKIKS